MKKSNLFSVLSLGLVGLFSLASCAPSSVTPEEGKAVLADMKMAYQNQEVEAKDQLHLKMVTTVDSVSSLATVKSESTISVMVDLTKKAVYTAFEANNNSFETWSYVKDGEFINALRSNNVKTYSKVKVNQEEIDELFKKSEGVELIDENTGLEAIEQMEEAIKEFEDFSSEYAKEAFGSKVEANVKADFKSNKAGQLHFIASANLSHARLEGQIFDVTVNAKSKIIFENYMLSEIETQEDIASEVAGQKFASNTYSKMTIKQKAKITLPNLDDFNEGGIVLPDIPDIDL